MAVLGKLFFCLFLFALCFYIPHPAAAFIMAIKSLSVNDTTHR